MAVLLVAVLPVASAAGAADPPRVMPLGDSITDGYNAPGGYRVELHRQLAAEGHGFDFVGSMQNGPLELPDQDHEGHTGWTIEELHGGVTAWLDANPADVVLLMAGTNNTKNENWTSAEDTAAKLGALIDTIVAHPSSETVIVSSIPPILSNATRNERVTAYNALIPGVADARAGAGVSFVDAAAGFTGDLTELFHVDGVHPNEAGHRRIADVFRSGLSSQFPSTLPVVAADSFDRADGPLGTTPTGQVWQTLGRPGWGVRSGEAAAVAGGGEGAAVVDAGTADGRVRSRITLSAGDASPSLALRAVDAQNYLLVGAVKRPGADRVSLLKRVAGGFTLLAEEVGVGLTGGGSYVLEARLSGPQIEIWLNGAPLLYHELSAADHDLFSAGTHHGLRTALGGADDGGSRWDDFEIATASEPPPDPDPDPDPDVEVRAADGFERADAPLGTADTGQAWQELGGLGWGVRGNQGAVVSGTGEGIAVLEADAADGRVSADVTLSAANASPSLALRAVDAQNYLLVGAVKRAGHDRISLFSRVSGAYTKLAEQTGIGLTPGVTYRLEARLDGPEIEIRLDGAVLFTHTLSGSGTEQFLGATRHGLRSQVGTADDGGSRWDDFEIAVPVSDDPPPVTCAEGEFTAEYFEGTTLSGTPLLTRCETAIDHDWGAGSPDPSVPVDGFSSRWTTALSLPAGGWTFTARGDDGIRLWVDEAPVIDQWTDGSSTTSETVMLDGGSHTVVVEHYENTGSAVAELDLALEEPPDPPTLLPRTRIVPEGDSGSATHDVVVELSHPSTETVTADWATNDTLDQPRAGVDYVPGSGTLVFEPGETSKSVPFTVLGDELDEDVLWGAEWGAVVLSAPTNAVVAPGQLGAVAFVLIVDDDPPPTIAPGAGSVLEGDQGTTILEVPVRLSAPSGLTVMVDWATVDTEQPEPGVDFEAAAGTVSFQPGETLKTVPITVYGDTVAEPGQMWGAEWGSVAFSSPVNATFGSGFLARTGLALIIDDD